MVTRFVSQLLKGMDAPVYEVQAPYYQGQGALPQAYMQSFVLLCHHEKMRCKAYVQR